MSKGHIVVNHMSQFILILILSCHVVNMLNIPTYIEEEKMTENEVFVHIAFAQTPLLKADSDEFMGHKECIVVVVFIYMITLCMLQRRLC